MAEVNCISGQIVDTAIRLRQQVGPGLLESVYATVLAARLERRGLRVERQKQVRFELDGFTFEEGLRVDLLVNELIIVELKSVEKLAPVHSQQVLTYLRLLNLEVGLLLNFGAATMKEGIRRIVNNYGIAGNPHSRNG